MALPPLAFSVPQQRPSLIEQAFATALGTAAGELISGPFERARERRREAAQFREIAYRSVTELDQAKKLGDIQFERHIQENYLPLTSDVQGSLKTIGIDDPSTVTLRFKDQPYIRRELAQQATLGARPITPTQRSSFELFDEFLPGRDIPTPTTEEEYRRSQPLLDQLVAAYTTNVNAGLRADQKKLTALNMRNNLLTNPDIVKYQGAYTRDTQRPLNRLEMVALANSADLETLDTDLVPDLKPLITRLRQMAQAIDDEGGAVIPEQPSAKVEDILKQVNHMRTTEGQEQLQGYLPGMLELNKTIPLLLWRGKPAPNHAPTAMQALKATPDLLTALVAVDAYGTADKVLLAERAQQGQLPYKAKQYMQYLFNAAGRPWDLAVDELKIPGITLPPLRQGGARVQPPGSTQQAPAAPTNAPGATGGIPDIPQPPAPVPGRVIGRAGPRVNVSKDLQGAYSIFYGALQSDPAVYPVVQAKLDSIFSLPRDQAAKALESYGWPKAVADSVRRSDAGKNHFRRNTEEALRRAWINLTNGEPEE